MKFGAPTASCEEHRRRRHGGSLLARNRHLSGSLLALALCALLPGLASGKPRATDRFHVYQLSYIESDRAVELLETFGYDVLDLTSGAATGKFYDTDTIKKIDLDEKRRPLVINLIDSSATTVDKANLGDFSKQETRLGDVTTGVPQQRLLIVWDQGEPADFQELLNLLHRRVDVPAKQILVQVLVFELDRDRFSELGISFQGDKDGFQASLLENPATGASLPLIFQFTRPSAKTVLEFTGRLKALVDTGGGEVLSQPSVLVLDGHQARISVKDKIPYSRELSSNLDAQSAIISNTEYIDVGITLNLRPRANEDDTQVTLQLETTISSASSPVQGTKRSGALIGPPVATRDIQTTVRVANNTPFVIGGLIRASRDVGRSGVPFLSKIPGLGRLFRTTLKSRSQKEVIVVITPHVIPPDDLSLTHTIAKDFELFDHLDPQLFRDAYRVRRDDVFDLAFVRESEFIRALDRRVVKKAGAIYQKIHQSDPVAWPAVPEDDRAALARQLRKAHAQRHEEAPPDAFLRMLEGEIPGEDKFVKRMLLEMIERQGYDRLVADEQIRYFQKQDCDLKDPSCIVLVPERLVPEIPDRKGEECRTLVVAYERTETSQKIPFDPPAAELHERPLPDDRFRDELRDRNKLDSDGQRWDPLGVLLNRCFRNRERSTLEHLKSALVLKRLLDLNPTLPLTLEGFHAGREVVLPTPDDLGERIHVVDREAAALFYETLDYYYAFRQTVLKVVEGLAARGLIENDLLSSAAPADSPSAPAPREEPRGSGGAQPARPNLGSPPAPARVEIVVWYPPEVDVDEVPPAPRLARAPVLGSGRPN